MWRQRAGFTLLEVVLAASILAAVGVVSIAGFLFFTRNQSVSSNYGDLTRNATVIQEVLLLDLERVSRVRTFDVTADPMVASGPWWRSVVDAGGGSWVLVLRVDDVVEEVTYVWDRASGVLRRSSPGGDRVFLNVFDFVLSDLNQFQVTVSGVVNEFWLLGSGAVGQEVAFSGTAVVVMR
jgi:type II secretory pathway pseudopilin PulG